MSAPTAGRTDQPGARRYVYPMEVAGAQLLRYREDAGRVVMDGEYLKEIWGEWLIHPDRRMAKSGSNQKGDRI